MLKSRGNLYSMKTRKVKKMDYIHEHGCPQQMERQELSGAHEDKQ